MARFPGLPLVVLVAMSSGCEGRRVTASSSTSDAPGPGGAKSGPWRLAKVLSGEKVEFIRLRTDLEPYAGPSRPTRIEIAWTYVGGPTGLPDNGTLAALEAFEDRLAPALEAGDAATLAIVVTRGGQRRWTFYAKDRSQTLKALGPLLPETSTIIVQAFDDPGWLEYRTQHEATKP